MPSHDPLRAHLARALDWGDAHATFEKAVRGLPMEAQGRRAPGFAHTCWEILEHMRLAQRDILDFCIASTYEEREWPEGYWPESSTPPSDTSWQEGVDAFRADRKELEHLVTNAAIDLVARVPRGTGQTFLREVLLVIDHNAYHLGQLVAVRRALGTWSD